MKRSASANWQGNLKDGKGHMSTESGALSKQPFGFNTRFEDGAGTNPEELIGAAHAGCFSMAFANELSSRDITVEDISTSADITLDKVDGGFKITRSHLTVNVKTSGGDTKYDEALQAAIEGCPVSNALDMDIKIDVNRG
ncbi:OsmC family protein [Robiginitomaculum antarcticum]|uniref:OsmC family protein n=1 Tax=Robiginitomaculum antarcticum TaxID=437507 RepID=UPI000368C9F5|nr:OsmC family protein [Robiginitomaculum antarcticum]